MSDSPYSGWDQLVEDPRLERVVAQVRESTHHNPWWDRMEFVTAVDPETSYRRDGTLDIPDHEYHVIGLADTTSKAQLRLVREGKLPGIPKESIVARGWLSGWREAEKERGHYVDRGDQLEMIVRHIAAALGAKLDNLSEIDDR